MVTLGSWSWPNKEIVKLHFRFKAKLGEMEANFFCNKAKRRILETKRNGNEAKQAKQYGEGKKYVNFVRAEVKNLALC